MSTLNVSVSDIATVGDRLLELSAEARAYRRRFRSASYGIITPTKFGYMTDTEPVIPCDYVFDGDDVTFTVNAYGALILNTKKLFIADVDAIDELDDALCDEQERWLKERLARSSEGCGSLFYGGRRLYRTAAGWRVICWEPISDSPWSDTNFDLLKYLRSDPRYVALCAQQKCYRARCTPKPWREDASYGPSRTCDQIAMWWFRAEILETTFDSAAGAQRRVPALVHLHDYLTGVGGNGPLA